MFARRFLFLYRADLSAPRKNSANSNYSCTYEIPGVGDIPVSLSDQFAPLLTRLFPLHAIALPATPLFPLHTQKQGGVLPKKCRRADICSPFSPNSSPVAGHRSRPILPRTHKRHHGRWPQRAPAMLQLAWSSGEHCGEQRLGLVEREGEAKEISAAGVGVFFVTRGFARGEVCEDIPGRVLGEEFFLRGVLAGNFYDSALGAAADFEEDGGGFFGLKRPRRIVVREGNQQARDLFVLGVEGGPPIAVAVVDDRAATEDLLDAGGVFACDADDHVHEFVEAKGLLHHRADADEAGVFFSVAEGDLFGERHGNRDCSGRPLSRSPYKCPSRGHQPSFESFSRTRSLRALPSTAFPVKASLAALTTPPICFIEVAPVSAMALAMAASISASLAPAGRYASRNFSSAFSLSTRSWRPPFANWSIDSLCCFTSVCSSWMDSVSSSGRIFSTSFSCSAALAMRRTLRRISSFPFIAATMSFFNCSERLIFAPLFWNYSRSPFFRLPF